MEKYINVITPEPTLRLQKKRVAAYARVSCCKDTMLLSLAAQIDYYKKMIVSNPEWEFVGVYADEAKTGTKDSREKFMNLLNDCRNGKIDMVLTKAISRFARNTVTLLSTVRELKDLGIDIFFEEQNMHSISAEGELMMTLMASVAQEESLSSSENVKWRIRKGFAKGQPSTCTMLGYRLIDGQITVVPQEAVIVKEIFNLYLAGCGIQGIANTLNENRVKTEKIPFWHLDTLRKILRNEKYTGDLILQKTFITDHITKRKVINDGQLPKYMVTDDHEPIISRETFDNVQSEIAIRAEKFTHKNGETSAFTGKIRCNICGKNYRRKTTPYNIMWCCSTYNSRGKKYCNSKAIPESTLIRAATDIMGTHDFDTEAFRTDIDYIVAECDNVLRFVFYDRRVKLYQWEHQSRSESWTDEMKSKARETILRRYANG